MKKFSLLIAALMLASCGGKPVSTSSSVEPSIPPISISTELPSESSDPIVPSESMSEPIPSESESEPIPSESESEPIPSESESEPEPIPAEPMTPADAIAAVAAMWSAEPVQIDEGVYGAFGAFSAESISVDDLKMYVSGVFTPEEFELVSDWELDEDQNWVSAYMNEVDTVLEWYVYSMTAYVDGEGMIHEEPVEGATEMELTCIEVYAYTYVEPVEPELAPIAITAENLIGYAGTNIQYGDGDAVIDEIPFSFLECGAYGNGIQMRTKNGKSSTIVNTSALPASIKSIDIKLNDGKQVYDNEHALRFTFGESADALGNEVVLDTVADQKEYTINVPEGVNALFFQLLHGITYSLYVDSITLNF